MLRLGEYVDNNVEIDCPGRGLPSCPQPGLYRMDAAEVEVPAQGRLLKAGCPVKGQLSCIKPAKIGRLGIEWACANPIMSDSVQ